MYKLVFIWDCGIGVALYKCLKSRSTALAMLHCAVIATFGCAATMVFVPPDQQPKSDSLKSDSSELIDGYRRSRVKSASG